MGLHLILFTWYFTQKLKIDPINASFVRSLHYVNKNKNFQILTETAFAAFDLRSLKSHLTSVP